MSRAYSLDLREKIIVALKNGSLQKNVASRFKVSLSSVARYWRIYKGNQDLEAKKPVITRPRKVNWSEVLNYVNNNKDKTLSEIGEAFKISARAVFYILKKNDYSFKKNHFYIKNETKMSERNLSMNSVKSRGNS